MKYVEFCAGVGGSRAGFDAAGWSCVFAIDHDPDAVLVHRMAHGDVVEGDVTLLSADEVPHADVWVAGFPCQPFSTSGNRLGFGHKSGNVFEHLARLVAARRPRVLILENVVGLLTNKAGHTFATILREITRLGYDVDWLVMDLRWHRVPQSRPRLFIVAATNNTFEVKNLPETPGSLPGIGSVFPSLFCGYLEGKPFSWSVRSRGAISSVIDRTSPAIGKAKYSGPHFFSRLGHASGDQYIAFDLNAGIHGTEKQDLAAIVAPEFAYPDKIRSVRYWSPNGGGGPSGLHIRDEPLSHCVGTSLGGAPLFAVPTTVVKRVSDRKAFLQFSNWHREQQGLLVMRLVPERAVLLFGPHTCGLSEAVGAWGAGATRKFKLVGNMVAPVCAKEIASIVDQHVVRNVPKGQREQVRVIDGKPSAGKSEELRKAGGQARGRK